MTDFEFLWDKNIIQTIGILGGLQGLILGVIVLFYPKQHRTSNIILSFFILSFALILLAARIAEFVPPKFMWPIYGIRFSSLMFLYFYINSLYKEINWKKEWWNFAILIIHISLSFTEYHVYEKALPYEKAVKTISFILQTATVLLYFILFFVSLHSYGKKVKAHFSSLHKLGFHWARQLVIGFLLLTIYQSVVAIYFAKYKTNANPYIPALFNTLFFTSYMYFIAIKGKLSPSIYRLRMLSDAPSEDFTENQEEEITNHKETPSAIDDNLNKIATLVLEHLEKNKSYLNSTLTLSDFAEELGIKPYLISQAINQVLHKSFFDLVNGFRVEEAKILLTDPKYNYLSVLGIGLEAGFNSKTTYNTVFKKITGLSPTGYKNQYSSEVRTS